MLQESDRWQQRETATGDDGHQMVPVHEPLNIERTTGLLLQISLAAPGPACGHSFGCNLQSSYSLLTACLLEPQTEVRKDFTNMEKAPTRAFSWLDAPTKEAWLA